MADLSYSIDVQTREAVQSIENLKSVLSGIATALPTVAFAKLNDSIVEMRNRLLNLTPDLATVNKQLAALGEISIRSRTGMAEVTDLFFRISRATKDLGVSQKEAAQITESLSKAMAASGLGAKEAAGPLLQLGQALQSGKFQGDELRSILEGLPPVSEALAKSLKVPVGALKEMGSKGQITAMDFVVAMRQAQTSIDEVFSRTTPTIAQGFERIQTAIKTVFAEFDRQTGTSQNLGKAMEYIARSIVFMGENIDKYMPAIKLVFEILIAFTAIKIVGIVIGGIAAAFQSLGIIVIRVGSYFGLFQKYLTTTTTASGAVVKGTTLLEASFFRLIDTLKQAFKWIVGIGAAFAAWSGLDKVIEWVKSFSDSNSEASKELDNLRESQKKAAEGLSEAQGPNLTAQYNAEELRKKLALLRVEMEAQVAGVDRSLTQTRDRLFLETALIDKSETGLRVSEDQAEILRTIQSIEYDRANAVASLQDNLKKLQTEYSQLRKTDTDDAKLLAGKIGLLKEQIARTNALYEGQKTGMEDLIRRNQTVKMLEEDRKRTSETIIKLIEEQTTRTSKLGDILRGVNDKIFETLNRVNPADLIGKSALEKEIINIEKSTKDAAQAAARQLAQAYEGLGDDITPQQAEAFAQGLDQIIERFNRLKEVQIGQAKVNATLQKSFDTGWAEAFAKYAESAKNAAEQAQSYFSIFTEGIEDAIVRFVQTGKLSFKDLANNIIAEFVRIQVRSQMLNVMGGGGLLSRLFGGFGGIGFGTGLGFGNLDYGGFFAKGGTLGAGKWGIAGEAGPEMVTGPATITPMTQMPSTTTINYNINAVDAQSFRAMVARDPEFIYQVTEAGRRSQPQRRLS